MNTDLLARYAASKGTTAEDVVLKDWSGYQEWVKAQGETTSDEPAVEATIVVITLDPPTILGTAPGRRGPPTAEGRALLARAKALQTLGKRVIIARVRTDGTLIEGVHSADALIGLFGAGSPAKAATPKRK